MRLRRLTVLCSLLLSGVAYGATPEYLKSQELRVEAATAAKDGDHAAAVALLTEALRLRPGHPGLLFALASAEAHIGDDENAMTHLQQVATMGIAGHIGGRPEFLKLALKPRFIGAKVQMEMNFNPVGAPVPALTLENGAVLFEGIAVDEGRVFISSVRERRILSVTDGVVADFVTAGEEGIWSVYGLAVDKPRGLLWAASAAGPMTLDLADGESGAAGLFAFDLQTGALKRKAVLDPALKASFGDLAVAEDGTVYASDSANAALWRLAPDAETPERVFDDLRFVSPQGLALSADGRTLVVADYATGLFAVDLAGGNVSRVSTPSAVTVLGIDGLALAGDGRLIATQNGISPERVIALEVDEDVTLVRRLTVLAANAPFHDGITLGTVAGDDYIYIAASSWARFEADGAQIGEDAFKPAIVAKLPLSAP